MRARTCRVRSSSVATLPARRDDEGWPFPGPRTPALKVPENWSEDKIRSFRQEYAPPWLQEDPSPFLLRVLHPPSRFWLALRTRAEHPSRPRRTSYRGQRAEVRR